jgi:hypothetical protein
MKKLSLLIFASLLSIAVSAQKYIPVLGIGSKMDYNVELTNMAQHVNLTLKAISLNDPMKFVWTVPGLGDGSFLIPAKALESGTKMVIKVPEPGQATVYKDDETILFISKASYTELIKNQTFTLNKIKFSVKPLTEPYLINTKEADVLYLVSENNKVEVLLLNNPDFPLIVKMTGNPAGFDFKLTSFKE